MKDAPGASPQVVREVPAPGKRKYTKHEPAPPIDRTSAEYERALRRARKAVRLYYLSFAKLHAEKAIKETCQAEHVVLKQESWREIESEIRWSELEIEEVAEPLAEGMYDLDFPWYIECALATMAVTAVKTVKLSEALDRIRREAARGRNGQGVPHTEAVPPPIAAEVKG